MSLRKHGGMWFARIGRIAITFCVVKKRHASIHIGINR